METIKNYLESMFRGLPLTEKVMKAKSELLQMMEDKYTELIRSGKTENEAVGEVIQNFGNLEDLADDLGIKEILHATKYSEVERKKISFEEITEYLGRAKMAAAFKAAGIMLCIISVIFTILSDALRVNEIIGVTLMFVSIGIGVVLMVLSGTLTEQWRYIKKEPCIIDAVTIDYLKNKNREFMPSYAVMHAVGILLCVLCFIPAAVFDEIGGHFWDEMSGAMLFIFVGFGVFLIVFSNSLKGTFKKLLTINEQTEFEETREDKINQIKSPKVRAVLICYWPVITCLYLSVSGLTFAWHVTWMIWPIAAAVFPCIIAISKAMEESKEKEEEENKEDAAKAEVRTYEE